MPAGPHKQRAKPVSPSCGGADCHRRWRTDRDVAQSDARTALAIQRGTFQSFWRRICAPNIDIEDLDAKRRAQHKRIGFELLTVAFWAHCRCFGASRYRVPLSIRGRSPGRGRKIALKGETAIADCASCGVQCDALVRWRRRGCFARSKGWLLV